MSYIVRAVTCICIMLVMMASQASAQIIEIETFGSGPYPGPPLPAGRTTYNYNAPAQPANFPNILTDGDYVLATNTQQGFTAWASIGDNTTGSGYMLLVNADDNQSGEFYRAQVPLTANTSYDFLTYLVNANSQGDFDFCTNNQGGLVLPNVTLQVEGNGGVVLASIDTGDIPFNPVPAWEQHQISFSTPAATSSVDVVLINNSVGGCGNDLAIDDITFRVAITMEAADDIITLTDTSSPQSAVLVLGANDTLDGNPLLGTENYTVAPLSSLPAGITLNGNTGEVGVAAGTPSGTYTFEYEVCETTNMFNCAIATATIIVDLPPLPISAGDDNGSVADSSTGFTPVLNVLDNDTVNNAAPSANFELSLSANSSVPSTLTFNENTGAVGVVQGAPTGIYTFDYDICEIGNPDNCETATVTIDVTNPNAGASFCPAGFSTTPGTFHVVSATGGNNPNGAVGQPLPEGTVETANNAAVTFFGPITMDLTGDPAILVPEGEVIEVVLSSHFGTGGRAEILMSADGVNYTSLGTTGNGGSVYGAWQSNVLRYDDFTVPAGGARFLQVLHQNSGVRADGVIYGAQCVEGSSSAPEIGIAKSASAPIANGNGTFDVTYTVILENTGDVSVINLQIEDDIAAQMGASFIASESNIPFSGVVTAPAAVLTNTSGGSVIPTVNAGYDGGPASELLSGTDGVLEPGDQVTVTFTVILNPNAAGAPSIFENQAEGTGEDPSGAVVTDASDDGSGPALNPGETAGSPTPVNLPATPFDPVTLPNQCGAFTNQGWITNGVIGTHDSEVSFNSGDPSLDPYIYLPLNRDPSGRILSYFGTPDANTSGIIPALAGSNLVSTNNNSSDHQSEYHLNVFRLDGAPGSTLTADLDTRVAQEHTAYWVEDSSGAVIAAADFVFTTPSSSAIPHGVGQSIPLSVTLPADGIIYVHLAVFDPTVAYGRPIISNYAGCPTPSLSLEKTADNPGPYTAGDVITYTYTVTNDGNQTVRDIAINDTHNGSDPAPIAGAETLLTDAAPIGDSTDANPDGSWDILAPGDSITFTGAYTVTQIDAENL